MAAASAPHAADGEPPVGALLALVAVVAALGVLLRFWCRSELWLDEALSVNIARLPLDQVPDALRRDGSPPLYYALLHGWIRVWGTGEVAVRSLSGVAAVAALPLAWFAGRRVGGRTGAAAAVVLLAASPFAIRYATEARMYALVLTLGFAGYLALVRALERPTVPRLAVLALVTALLLYTHYWAMFLLVVVGAGLAWAARTRSPARRCLVALALGAATFLPWVPVFLWQAEHTGAPWAHPPHIGMLARQLRVWAWDDADRSEFVALAYVVLLLIGLFGRRGRGRSVELVAAPQPPAAVLAAVVAATLLLGWGAAYLGSGAFAGRYSTIVLAPFLLVLAVGVRRLPGPRAPLVALAVVALFGLGAGAENVDAPRTQAVDVARAIGRQGVDGDVVAYCPADLGPAVDRLLPEGFRQVTFPDGGRADLVDWVDLLERTRRADVGRFADDLVAAAGSDHRIFVVWTSAHGPTGVRCESLVGELVRRRPADVVFTQRPRFQERSALIRFDP